MFISLFQCKFQDTILYTHDMLSLDEVYDALFSKDNMKHLMVGYKTQVEGLVA